MQWLTEMLKRPTRIGRLAQLVERFVYTEDVGGSSPSSPTIASKDVRIRPDPPPRKPPRKQSFCGDRLFQQDDASTVGSRQLALRLRALAPTEARGVAIVVGFIHLACRLIGNLFEVKRIRPQKLHGFDTPTNSYHVIGEGRAEGRFDALHVGGIAPMAERHRAGHSQGSQLTSASGTTRPYFKLGMN